MRTVAFCVLVTVCVCGCKDKTVPVDLSVAPVLKGCVSDIDGNPIGEAEITLYGDFYTRWKVASVQTNANGEYMFDPCCHGIMIFDGENQRWDYFIGMTISCTGYKSTDGKARWNVRVPQIDRHVIMKNFVMVPN